MVLHISITVSNQKTIFENDVTFENQNDTYWFSNIYKVAYAIYFWCTVHMERNLTGLHMYPKNIKIVRLIMLTKASFCTGKEIIILSLFRRGKIISFGINP